MPDITISLTETENKAMEYAAASVQDWADNAVTNRARIAVDDIVKLYLKGLLTFQRKFDIEMVGPSNEHMTRFKWYVINIDKSKTLKDIKSVIKAGKVA